MKLKMTTKQNVTNAKPLGWVIGHSIEAVLHEAYPNIFTSTIDNINSYIISNITAKFISLDCEILGSYSDVEEGFLTVNNLTLAKTLSCIELLSFLKDNEFMDIPKEDIESIMREGSSTNKTIGEDTPISGDASFENFVIESPSAKAISRNDAEGNDTHTKNNIDVYLKRQEFYMNYTSVYQYVEYIFKSLTKDYNEIY